MSCKIRVRVSAETVDALGEDPEREAAKILCTLFSADRPEEPKKRPAPKPDSTPKTAEAPKKRSRR